MLEKINYSLIEGIEEITNQIIEKEEKKDIIVGFIKKLNMQNKYEKYLQNSSILNEANNIYDSIKNEIELLVLLENKAKEINKKIAVLLACIQTKENDEIRYNTQIENIKEQLEIYNAENEKIKKIDIENNVKINNLSNNKTFKEYFNAVYPNFEGKYKKATNKDSVSNKSFNYAENEKDNPVLIISEKKKKVYLPYKARDLQAYVTKYPEQYRSEEDVILREYVRSLDNYMRFPVLERFKETYSLIRDKEAKPFIEALKYALELMFKSNLNPAIIAACSSQDELERYLLCLESNKTNEFKDFEIIFEVNPI